LKFEWFSQPTSRFDRYFFIRSITALVIAIRPVRIRFEEGPKLDKPFSRARFRHLGMREKFDVERASAVTGLSGPRILAALVFLLVALQQRAAQAQEFDPVKAGLDEVDQLNIVLRAEQEDASIPNPAAELPAKTAEGLPTTAEVLQDPLPPSAAEASDLSSGTSALRSSESLPASSGGTVEIQNQQTNQLRTDVNKDPLTLNGEFRFLTSSESDESTLSTISDGKSGLDRLLLSKRDAISGKALRDWTLQDFTALKNRALEFQ